MDKHTLAILIPVIALAFTGLITFSFTPLGRALARRLGGQAAHPELDERVAQLESDLEAVRHELSESHERIDFAERALAQLRDQRQLPSGTP
jgi:hypothetical protein